MGLTPLQGLVMGTRSDSIVFTGGIGENSADVRARICKGLDWMGLELDCERNAAGVEGFEGRISKESSRLAAYVIPTDEELLIARETLCEVLRE